MTSRAVDALAVPIAAEPIPPEQAVAGAPTAGSWVINAPELPTLEVGIWEHAVGVSTDSEADEVFVVIAGRATVVIDGGATLELRPGTVGILQAGAQTTWTVHERLRKVYLTPA